jgi:prevent-host-death family protein
MTEVNVGLRELKTHLSQYMRQVKSGDTIVITEHGRPVGLVVWPEAFP